MVTENGAPIIDTARANSHASIPIRRATLHATTLLLEVSYVK